MRSAFAAGLLVASAAGGHAVSYRMATEPVFPAPARPVAPVVSPRWSTEDARDAVGEADKVVAALGPLAGRTVADIGAGDGYYEGHLARAVGTSGSVVAEDIDPATVAGLAQRVAPMKNVRAALGRPDDARLPDAAIDVVLMVHMYHEIAQPYALLWRLRASLRPGGRVAIVDADRPTAQHGTPPRLLACELAAVGFVRTSTRPVDDGIYLAVFDKRNAPRRIVACR
ncbi:MAG: methyltransferase domain-containing protein [Janthinobacterium lividum]